MGSRNLSRSKIEHVNVSAQPRVVSQIPAGIIRIIVEDDIVSVPKPAIDEDNVCRGHAEVEAAEPEAIGTTAFNPPYMARTELAGETSMLPGVIEVIAGVIAAFIVPDPAIVGSMDVRRLGMARTIIEFAVVGWRLVLPATGSYTRSLVSGRLRTVSRDVSAAKFWTASTTLVTMLLASSTLRFAAFSLLRYQKH